MNWFFAVVLIFAIIVTIVAWGFVIWMITVGRSGRGPHWFHDGQGSWTCVAKKGEEGYDEEFAAYADRVRRGEIPCTTIPGPPQSIWTQRGS